MKNIGKILTFLSFVLLFSCGITKIPNVPQITATKIHQVAPDSAHARGIAVVGNLIFTANNNGFVYQFNINTHNFQQLTQISLPELRDIYVLTEDYFIAMQSAEYSDLLLSKGLVEQFVKPFEHKTFLDGIDINANGFGVLMGDPLEGQLYVATTSNFGKTWSQNIDENLKSLDGEAGFAASGSTVQVLNDSTYIFVTGGKASRFFKTENYGTTWTSTTLDFKKSEGSGPFSVHFWTETAGVVVGGDYMSPTDSIQNCYLTNDGGKTWKKPLKNPLGYRSSVIACENVLFCCGTSGIDYSLDFGQTWISLNSQSSFSLGKSGGKVFATLAKGQVLEIEIKY